MPRKPKPKPDDPAESKRFIELARELECDERPEAFDRAFRKIVPAKKPSSGKG
jgi:hypothetical protein